MKIVLWLLSGILLVEFVPAGSEKHGSDLGVANHNRQRRSTETSSYFYYQEPHYPRDCKEVYDQCDDETESGIFLIQPDGAPEPFQVYCNNSIDGGYWTVILRRVDGSVNFFRDWDDYKNGFGFLRREFWLGNDKISYITNQGNYELRIDVNNQNGVPYFAKYNLFRISDESSNYRLTDVGDYLSESTTGFDALSYHRNMSFTTRGRDNDKTISRNCAEHWYGAWWHNECHHVHLMGLYFGTTFQSISWKNLPGGNNNLKYAEMKLRSVA